MIRTLKILSILLSYPDEEFPARDLSEALDGEALLPPACHAKVTALIDDIAACDLYDARERYVYLFDRTRSLSLHLFEHVHGESRDRGQAMVDLSDLYERNGFRIAARELPDYLPLFLEFAATLPLSEARDLVAQPLDIFSTLTERLRRRGSPYTAVFEALEEMANGVADVEEVKALLQEPDDDPGDLAAIDRVWEETAVSFGPAAAPGEAKP